MRVKCSKLPFPTCILRAFCGGSFGCLVTASNFYRRMIPYVDKPTVLELSLRKWSKLARFEVLTSVLMKFSVFWDVTLYMLLYNHRSEYYVPFYTASCPRRVESCYIETWKFSRKRELNISGSSDAMTYIWIGISVLDKRAASIFCM